jgi:hypothetical protein
VHGERDPVREGMGGLGRDPYQPESENETLIHVKKAGASFVPSGLRQLTARGSETA